MIPSASREVITIGDVTNYLDLDAYTIVQNHGKNLFNGIKEVVTSHMQNKVIKKV